MDERSALGMLADELGPAGDDAAVIDGLVVTTDMLHERTDFPPGTTRYTAGWRTIGASLSDVAAMGGAATAAVAAYGAPTFDPDEIRAFVDGASDVCALTGAEYVGGDLDNHDEFTVAGTVVGKAEDPVYRSGASPGEAIYVTGTLGRTGAAVREFDRGNVGRGNELFQFEPRVAAGRQLASVATAMMDSSDGLARSLHQLAAASDCGFHVEWDRLPVDPSVDAVAANEAERRELSTYFGEDFELVFTASPAAVDGVRDAVGVSLTRLGTVTDSEVLADGEPLPDRGYTH
ncbi:thiamine-phosphate kinase [Haloplanus aerogenes]|uniref:Thiamine-monophosphate kinase n=1 Tax=Haloplanus aerogenes TaxID=660522 RepID=A0A3G8QSL1_9EURY|nr:thiamine-phosphate kinase [Haloplanus aerogenes]AZH24472.1 thiamine-phosphate kinase [Haloplanus aerogenes]RMB23880.1 thiamine-phosphate kinase [Haloplanus aerogenes]